jgi:hypothetical protein
MGPFSQSRPRLAALLALLPRTALAHAFQPGASVGLSLGFFLISAILLVGRRLLGSAPGAVMARLAMAAPGGSARSGALRAAAGRGTHALSAAAPAVSCLESGGENRASGRAPPILL